MKRLLLALLLLATPALAEMQTWTCDENPAEEMVTEYRLFFDGVQVATTSKPPWPAVDMPPGKHVVTARAANARAVSDESVPVTLPAHPGQVKNVRK